MDTLSPSHKRVDVEWDPLRCPLGRRPASKNRRTVDSTPDNASKNDKRSKTDILSSNKLPQVIVVDNDNVAHPISMSRFDLLQKEVEETGSTRSLKNDDDDEDEDDDEPALIVPEGVVMVDGIPTWKPEKLAEFQAADLNKLMPSAARQAWRILRHNLGREARAKCRADTLETMSQDGVIPKFFL